MTQPPDDMFGDMTEWWRTVGANVRSLRDQLNLTQDALADALGYSRSRLASIETGAQGPGITFLLAAADFFKVSMDRLISRVPPPGGPYPVHLVDDPGEIRWLNFYRNLSHEDRVAVLRILRIEGERRLHKDTRNRA